MVANLFGQRKIVDLEVLKQMVWSTRDAIGKINIFLAVECHGSINIFFCIFATLVVIATPTSILWKRVFKKKYEIYT